LAKPFGRALPDPGQGSEPVQADGPSRSDAEEAAVQTAADSIVGTPSYMSPEQATGDHPSIGPASDIYSLGATLYQILTGRPPFGFRREDAAACLEAIMEGKFPRPREVKPGVPRPLEAVCLKAMATTPGDRYATALALAEEIKHWEADEPVSAHRDPVPARVARWSRRHKATTTAAIFSLFIAVSIPSIFLFFNNREFARELSAREREGRIRFEDERRNAAILLRTSAAEYAAKKRAEGVEIYDKLVRQAEARLRSEFATAEDRVHLARCYLYRGIVEFPGLMSVSEGSGPSEYWSPLEALSRAIASGMPGALADQAHTREAEAWFDRAVNAFDSVPKNFQSEYFRTEEYQHGLIGRGALRLSEKRYTEGLIDWNRAFDMGLKGPIPWLTQARSIIVKGAEQEQCTLPWSRPPKADHPKAMRMAEYLAGQAGVSDTAVYNAACVFALASADHGVSPQESRRRADRAMGYLRRIAASGYFRPGPKGLMFFLTVRDADTLNNLRTDHDLDPLRSRPDFKALVAEVGAGS
jgi:hypothetical protein